MMAMNPLIQGFEPSCTTPNGPTAAATPKPSAQNNTMIPRQKTSACAMPPRWFRKNETVIGIMGKTHGVKMVARPNPKAASRNPIMLSEVCGVAGATGAAAPPPAFTSVYSGDRTNPTGAGADGSMVKVNDAVFFLGGRHWRASQA